MYKDNTWLGVEKIGGLEVVSDDEDGLYMWSGTPQIADVIPRYKELDNGQFQADPLGDYVRKLGLPAATGAADVSKLGPDDFVEWRTTEGTCRIWGDDIEYRDVATYFFSSNGVVEITRDDFTEFMPIKRYRLDGEQYVEDWEGDFVDINGNKDFRSIIDEPNTVFHGTTWPIKDHTDVLREKTYDGSWVIRLRGSGKYYSIREAEPRYEMVGTTEEDVIVTKDMNGVWVLSPSETDWYIPNYDDAEDGRGYPEAVKYPLEDLRVLTIPAMVANEWYLHGNPSMDYIDLGATYGSTLKVVWRYDPENGWYGWSSTDGNTDDEVDARVVPPMQGVWLQVNTGVAETTYNVRGRGTPYITGSGWNLIGHNKLLYDDPDNITLKDVLRKYSAKNIWGFRDGNWYGINSKDGVSFEYVSEASKTINLNNYEGMWIKGVANKTYLTSTKNPQTPNRESNNDSSPGGGSLEVQDPDPKADVVVNGVYVDTTFAWPEMVGDNWYLLGNPRTGGTWLSPKNWGVTNYSDVKVVWEYRNSKWYGYNGKEGGLPYLRPGDAVWIQLEAGATIPAKTFAMGDYDPSKRLKLDLGWNFVCENYREGFTLADVVDRYSEYNVSVVWVFIDGMWYGSEDDPTTVVNPNNISYGMWVRVPKGGLSVEAEDKIPGT
jgi:hypothetical protein